MEMPKGRRDLALAYSCRGKDLTLAYSFRRIILLSFGPMSIQVQKCM